VVEGNILSSEADQLFKGGFCVAQSTFRLAGEQDEGFIGNFNLFCVGDLTEVGADEGIGDTAKVEPLTAGEDRCGEFLDFGGGEDEFDVGGRLFKGF